MLKIINKKVQAYFISMISKLDMDIYKVIEECNPNQKLKILIIFDEFIDDTFGNKKHNSITTRFSIRYRKLNIFFVFLTQYYLGVPNKYQTKTYTLLEKILKLIMTTDEKIINEKLQYVIDRKAVKISGLLSGKFNKYDQLTGEKILSSDKRRVIEQGNFTYFSLSKTF